MERIHFVMNCKTNKIKPLSENKFDEDYKEIYEYINNGNDIKDLPTENTFCRKNKPLVIIYDSSNPDDIELINCDFDSKNDSDLCISFKSMTVLTNFLNSTEFTKMITSNQI